MNLTPMIFTDVELEYLASQRLGRLATAQPDGTLQVSPVGFAYNPDTATIDIGVITRTCGCWIAARARRTFLTEKP